MQKLFYYICTDVTQCKRILFMTQKELEEKRDEIANFFRVRRNKLLMSAREINELCGLTTKTIYKIEQGRPCSLDTYIIYDHTLNKLELKHK